MGYLTRIRGEIEIVPPVTWKEIRDKGYHVDGMPEGTWKNVQLEIVSCEKETDEGTLRIQEGVRVTSSSSDRFKAFNPEGHLQELVDAFPGHEFVGYLEGDGEEAGDMWRLHVVNGKAVKVTPEIVWPEM